MLRKETRNNGCDCSGSLPHSLSLLLDQSLRIAAEPGQVWGGLGTRAFTFISDEQVLSSVWQAGLSQGGRDLVTGKEGIQEEAGS